jgi:phospholipase C
MAPLPEHVVVLALENRSFDHMLGYLDHPSPDFDGLIGKADDCRNPGWGGGTSVCVDDMAKTVLPIDPDHAHTAIMAQLGVTLSSPDAPMDGFVRSYERKARGLSPATHDGPIGNLYDVAVSGLQRAMKAGSRFLHRSQPTVTGVGPLIMKCQNPANVPVLATLAKEFAVCTRWFASVPGETWPNRNFMHAATSDTKTDIDPRFYREETIFQRLEQGDNTWRIYHDDTPQVWAFDALWKGDRIKNWFRNVEFKDHVAAGDLARYTFMEPNHRPPIHDLGHNPVFGEPDHSNNQHPGNNLATPTTYATAATNAGEDFTRGEQLIAYVYESLRSNYELFCKTVLVITWDEHGGLYDHVAPPADVPPPDNREPAQPLNRLLDALFRRSGQAFDFRMLGVRVPAVIISPYIRAGYVDTTVRDHTTIPRTLQDLFLPDDPHYLSERANWSPPFHDVLKLDQPRRDLPPLDGHYPDMPDAGTSPTPSPSTVNPTADDLEVPAFFEHLVKLAHLVDEEFPNQPNAPSTFGPRAKATYVTREFASEAARARRSSQGTVQPVTGSPQPNTPPFLSSRPRRSPRPPEEK